MLRRLLLTSLALAAWMVTQLAVFTGYESAQKILEHISGWKEEWAFKEHCYLALLKVTPATSGNEGVTMKKVKEAEVTVTGYSRFKIEKLAGHELKFGNESTIEGYLTNKEEWEVETGLSGANQEVTYWALVQESSGESGKVIAWGSCTGTSIGATGTPVKVAIEKLKIKLG